MNYPAASWRGIELQERACPRTANSSGLNNLFFAGKPAPTGFAASGGKLNPKRIKASKSCAGLLFRFKGRKGAHVLAGTETAPPATMGETFEKLTELGLIDSALMVRIKKAVGFRNIAILGYDKIDYEIVFQIIHKKLTDFKRYAQAIIDAEVPRA